MAATNASLPSWPCRFDPGHPLHAQPQVNPPVGPPGEVLEGPQKALRNPFMTPVFRCVGHEWVTQLGAIRPGRALVCPPRDHNGSRDELEAVSGGDPPSNFPDWNRQAL